MKKERQQQGRGKWWGWLVLGMVCVGWTGALAGSERWEEVVAEERLRGGGLIRVSAGGEEQLKVFGEDGSGEAVEERTLFRAGSVSKLVTSLLMLRAEEAGKLSLKDPVEKYLPGVIEGNGREAVLVEHLLEHTSGLAGSTYGEYAMQARRMALKEYVERKRPFRLRWEPGLHFSYSNPGVTLAGRVLELAWGESFDQVARRELFGPLGMKDSHFAGPEDVPGGEALRSFASNGRRMAEWKMPVRPAGSLVTHLSDMSQLLKMLLAGGRLPDGTVFLSEASIQRFENAQASLAARAGLGEAIYATGNFPYLVGGKVYRGHWGRTEGFQTNLGFNRETGWGFVLWTNTGDRAAMGRLREWAGSYPSGEVAMPEIAAQPLPEIPSTTGVFVNISEDMVHRAWLFHLLFAVKIEPGERELRIASALPWFGSQTVWWHTGENQFQAESLPFPTGTLVEWEGSRYWVEGDSYRATSTLWFGIQWVALGGGIIMSILLLPLSLILLIRSRFVRERTEWTLWLSLCIAAASFLLMFYLYLRFGLSGELDQTAKLGNVTLLSVALTLLSILGPLGTLTAIFISMKGRSKRLFPMLLSLPLLMLSLLLGWHGWVPLITWNF